MINEGESQEIDRLVKRRRTTTTTDDDSNEEDETTRVVVVLCAMCRYSGKYKCWACVCMYVCLARQRLSIRPRDFPGSTDYTQPDHNCIIVNGNRSIRVGASTTDLFVCMLLHCHVQYVHVSDFTLFFSLCCKLCTRPPAL